MKYVSIDIETTGLDWDKCQILEFAAVVDDLDQPWPGLDNLPVYHRYLYHDAYYGEPYAIWLNRDYFEKRAKLTEGGENFNDWITPDQLMYDFLKWGGQQSLGPKKWNVAGKNFNGFDKNFLSKLPNFDQIIWHHRTTDPGPLYLQKGDKEPPDLQECLKRAGIRREVKHTAVEDAQDVVLLLRHHLGMV